MLLNELTGVKSKKGHSAYDILTVLKKEHNISIARGLFGLVMINPTWDHVIKLFAEDECYMGFVEHARSHPNKHFPKFKKAPMKMSGFFKNVGSNGIKLEKYYAIKVETLEPIPESGDVYVAIDAMDGFRFRHGYEDSENKEEFVKSFFKNGEDMLKFKSFFDAVVEVANVCDRGKCFVDLHDGNFMMRGDVPVIIDPFAPRYSKSTTDSLFTKNELDLLTDQKASTTTPFSKETLDWLTDQGVQRTASTMADAFNRGI